MKKIALLLLIILPLGVLSQAQTISAVAIESFRYDADEFAGCDKFGYAYFIKDNVFIKTKAGEKIEYKKISTGKITHVDIDNPLLIALFYENFNTIVLLDNQLNEIREINFVKLNIPVVANAAGVSSQNRVWIYDSLTQQIGLFDYLRNSYQPITTPFRENLKYYQSDFNTFQWVDTKSNWYLTDIFGKVYSLGKVSGGDVAAIASDHAVFYAKDGKLYLEDVAKKVVYTITGIDNSFKKIYYKDQILSIFTSGGITNYKITIP